MPANVFQRPALVVTAFVISSLSVCHAANPEARVLQRVSVPEARQGVAVDRNSFYAITNRAIARYKKGSVQQLAKWTAAKDSHVLHLNSGSVHAERLYCANSNWPAKPLKNTIEVFQAETLTHLETIPFSESEGAINWIDRHDNAWWVVFAFYGEEEVRRTYLVRYDQEWNETGRWTFPESVVQRFLPKSNSGGSFGPDGKLYVTGHDHAELYVLDIPERSGKLVHLTTVDAAIAGQGIAWDRNDPGVLYGIVRKGNVVVKLELTDTSD